MIGCVESNPGPSSDGVGSTESGGGDSALEDSRMEESGASSNETESIGEDIEDVEFDREEESSDEETSQDRAFRHDSPQPLGRPPSCEYAAMDAELWPSDTESDVRLGGRKRGKRGGSDQSGESQPRQRRRRQVIMSSSFLSGSGRGNQRVGLRGGGTVFNVERVERPS